MVHNHCVLSPARVLFIIDVFSYLSILFFSRLMEVVDGHAQGGYKIFNNIFTN